MLGQELEKIRPVAVLPRSYSTSGKMVIVDAASFFPDHGMVRVKNAASFFPDHEEMSADPKVFLMGEEVI